MIESCYDVLLKIVIIGDSGVGKSSLLMRFINDKYEDKYISTMGVDFKLRTIKINDLVVKVQVWDTAGTEKFASMTSAYYRGSHGIIFVYSLTDPNSYKSLSYWIKEVDNSAGIRNQRLLVGNKSDLSNKRSVTITEAKEFADSRHMQYIETSAKTSENVEEAFLTLVDNIIVSFPNVVHRGETIDLKTTKNLNDSDGSCISC